MDPLMAFIWIPSGFPKDYLGNPYDGGGRAMGRLRILILGKNILILVKKHTDSRKKKHTDSRQKSTDTQPQGTDSRHQYTDSRQKTY